MANNCKRRPTFDIFLEMHYNKYNQAGRAKTMSKRSRWMALVEKRGHWLKAPRK
jgi:hypothetical protein